MLALVVPAVPSLAQTAAKPAEATGPPVRVVGVVRDELNAITLPGVPVEVVGTNEIVYTDVDGRYVLHVAARDAPNQGADGGLSGKAD